MSKIFRTTLSSFLTFVLLFIGFAVSTYSALGSNQLIEGQYTAQTSGGTTETGIQVYFKNGILRTLKDGDNFVRQWNAGNESSFAFRRGSGENSYQLKFSSSGENTPVQFKIFNNKNELVLTGTRQGNIDESSLNPRSKSDRLGYFERHYTKLETMVSMRDGTRLLTQVFSPLDSSQPHPVIFIRSPYGIEPYNEAFTHYTLPSLQFARENYIIVMQDIRGRSLSEGDFIFHTPYIENKMTPESVDESSDAWDTIEWVLENIPGHNGKVGVWGSSYPGFSAAMAAVDSHPAVKAVSPQAPMADLFMGDDGHHLGALYLAHYAGYSYSVWRNRNEPVPYTGSRFRYPTPDGYDFFLSLGTLENIGAAMFSEPNLMWQGAMEHETYDAYWKSRSIYRHLKNIKPAILTVGGWFDGEDLLGTLTTYRSIEKQNPGLANTLVMGPWVHSGWNQAFAVPEKLGPFSYKGTVDYFHEQIELPFFNHYLKGTPAPEIPEMLAYDTGRDKWDSFDKWPPSISRQETLYFSDSGRLSDSKPGSATIPAFDEFISDPAKPVPYTMKPSTGYNPEYFVEDQRFASSRPDVLVYVTPPLEKSITIAGLISANLHVSTTGSDADWIVKVIDVFPGNADTSEYNFKGPNIGGYQRLVRGDIIRGKFRNSFEIPEAFLPGETAQVRFDLPDVFHTFRKGHRIMVHVQSSWFPLFDRNPQAFCNIRKAKEKDFQKAVHRIFRSPGKPSALTFNAIGGRGRD